MLNGIFNSFCIIYINYLTCAGRQLSVFWVKKKVMADKIIFMFTPQRNRTWLSLIASLKKKSRMSFFEHGNNFTMLFKKVLMRLVLLEEIMKKKSYF